MIWGTKKADCRGAGRQAVLAALPLLSVLGAEAGVPQEPLGHRSSVSDCPEVPPSDLFGHKLGSVSANTFSLGFLWQRKRLFSQSCWVF